MSRLVRLAYKSVAYGLRYHTINQRLLESAQKFDGHYHDLYETKKLTCPKKVEEVMRVLEMGNECGAVLAKLVVDYKHFKLHEEPNLIASNMFRDFVLPCAAGAGLALNIVNTYTSFCAFCIYTLGNIQMQSTCTLGDSG
ncbi:hypothetical protein MKW92_003423 [Papaver armeniacum]|nr:hypothetical protein MKW92_003423 [Papaver armeniacum]